MTQEYLAGELSLLLGQLEYSVTAQPAGTEIARLRRRGEVGSRSALRSAAVGALLVCDRVCWDSLGRGDVAGFASQSAICAKLWEFSVCSGLVEER